MKKKLFILIIMICTMFVYKTDVFALEDGKDLYDLIKDSASSDTINFNKRSGTANEETNGIYVTDNTENDVPVYYYRGTVDNNLIFNNMCWKIIRTTEKNGIKLIYNGLPENGKCNKTGTDTQIGTSRFNIRKSDNAYVGYMYGDVSYTFIGKSASTSSIFMESSSSYYYGTDFTFNTLSGYSLSGTIVNGTWSSSYVNYYTCLSDSSDAACDTLYYITAYDSSTSATGYKYTSTFKASTSYNQAHSNINSSTIKTVLDTWYGANFTNESIENQLEDTVFYSDRRASSDTDLHNAFRYTNGLFGPNKTAYATLERATYITRNLVPSLKYSVKNDTFTTDSNNGNGALVNPVGLITLDEAVLAGFNSEESSPTDYKGNNYLTNGETYWTMSPIGYEGDLFIYGSWVGTINNNYINYDYVDKKYGVRPVIALSNGVGVKSTGDGSENNPYVASLYTVKFDVSNISNQYMFDTTSKVVKPTDPSKEGYTFDGWYTESTLTNKYDFEDVVSSSLTLYAKWTKNVVEEEIKEEPIIENNTNIETNPKTGDFILINILFGIISLVVLIVSVIYLKKKSNKMN